MDYQKKVSIPVINQDQKQYFVLYHNYFYKTNQRTGSIISYELICSRMVPLTTDNESSQVQIQMFNQALFDYNYERGCQYHIVYQQFEPKSDENTLQIQCFLKYYKPKKLYLLKKGSELVKQEEEEIEELAEEE